MDIQVRLRIVPRELDPRAGLAFQGVLGKSRLGHYVGGGMCVIGVGSMPLPDGWLSVESRSNREVTHYASAGGGYA